MKIDQQNFAKLVNHAMQSATVSHMRAVIEKELLHYDILFALEKGGLLDQLVFQGGTSLRLCYGGNRFS
jgi:predicted nucleotidyltransferase component of viral defense system